MNKSEVGMGIVNLVAAAHGSMVRSQAANCSARDFSSELINWNSNQRLWFILVCQLHWSSPQELWMQTTFFSISQIKTSAFNQRKFIVISIIFLKENLCKNNTLVQKKKSMVVQKVDCCGPVYKLYVQTKQYSAFCLFSVLHDMMYSCMAWFPSTPCETNILTLCRYIWQ